MKAFWRAVQFWGVLLFAAAVLCIALEFMARVPSPR